VARKWWIVAVAFEFVEAAILCGVSPNRAPLELAALIPLTSQVLAIVAICDASQDLPRHASKQLASHMLIISLIFILLSLLVLVLSVEGFLHRQIYVQCDLFILSLAIGLYPADSNERSTDRFTRRLYRRLIGRASQPSSYQFLPVDGPPDGPLPPPNAHLADKYSPAPTIDVDSMGYEMV
jgi:hypothetical protein